MIKEIKNLKIQVNDQTSIEIDAIASAVVIKNYMGSKRCPVMTLNYPDDWAYSMALQHALGIAQGEFI